MAGTAKTHYFEGIILSWLKGTAMPTPPAALYVALFTADPGEGSSYTNEVSTSGTAYARVAVTFGANNTQTTGTQINASANVLFAAATANWGTVTYFAIVDAASGTGGNMYYHAALSAAITVNTGNIVQFNSGSGGLSILED